MLKSNSWKKKLVAMLLIFTLTFSNFALVGQSFAASIFGSDDDEGDTGSANVEFDATFVVTTQEETTEETAETAETTESDADESKVETVEVKTEKAETTEVEEAEIKTEGTESTDVKADVNSDTLSVKLNVSVSNSGYLKDAKIILGNGEEVNFTFDSDDLENSSIQAFEDDTIELVQLNADSSVEITFPIYYDGGSYVELDKISKSNVIKFEGTYVDDEEEISVSKEVTLNLNWQDNRETTVSSEVTKYINYSVDGNSGIILQVLVKADNTTENKTLPVNTSELEVTVPQIGGVAPETIKVVANSLMGTNGKTTDEVEFTEDNWNYDTENNILTITVENESELVSLQNEDDVLIDETVEEVEAYYAASGTDEYLITYIYNGVTLEDSNVTSKITSTFNMYGDTELVASEEATYELTEEIGDIVTFSTETETESISKGYTYLNYNNTDNKYEIEIDNKLIFNISYKDIVSGLYYEDSTNYYITSSGDSVEQSDIYYKSLKINKTNFVEILGEEGLITISDSSGNVLATINSETTWAEDGTFELTFDGTQSIRIETSSPVSEGNLVFTTVRAYTDTSIDKATFKTFAKIQMNSTAKAKYTYVEDYVDCGTAMTEVALDDTTTNATLEIGQDSLSTLVTNSNVEIKVVLNNDKITSDVYGDSEFIIQMPNYVESVEFTDYNIVYGEGLELSNIEAYEQDGSIFLKINVTGTQTALSSGIVSNGTNIVINANIKVNLYAPATTEYFKLTYTNSEATSYQTEQDGVGYNETAIAFSAPSGVISVNSISGYNESGDTVASVNQGTVMGDLDLYTSSRTATMEIIIMNNEGNTISNLSILGRTIYAGNTDILTGDDLGTTLDAVMVSSISSDIDGFTIYYSTNGNATNDLTNSENGWTTEITDWSTVKSYLIVPTDSSYELGTTEKLRFTYQFTIPENLAHNEYFYGTFATYYTNNSELATTDETSVADIVGLTTGIGPDIEISSSLGSTEVNEFEQFEFSVTVTNVGEVTAKNVVINIPIPSSDVTYKKTNTDIANYTVSKKDDGSIQYDVTEIEVGSSVTLTAVFYVDEISNVDDDDIVNLELYATATCDDFGTTISTDTKTITVNQATIKIELESTLDDYGKYYTNGDQVKIAVYIYNLTSEDISNATVTMYLDDIFEFSKGTILAFDDEGIVRDNEIATFNSSSRTITWNVDSLSSVDTTTVVAYFTVGLLPETNLSKTVSLSAQVSASSIDTATSADYDILIGRPSVTITQKTNTTNSYVTEGSTIEYVFEIKNEGTVEAYVSLSDKVPNGLVIKKIAYTVGSTSSSETMTETDTATTGLTVDAGETAEVTVTAYAKSLNGAAELSVTNVGSISESTTNETSTSNSITHIIEGSGTSSSVMGESSTGVTSSSTSTSSSNLNRTYNISGIAWVDENGDGARDNDETLVKGVTATLVDSDSAVIKQTTTTNSNGEYKFSGVSNGNYIVIFDYDTVLYTVTTYQKENVASNVNSDVISTKIEQDGNYRNGAVSGVVTISDSSISNIDIGLVEALTFDLSLNMGITKITVQNSNGTKTTTYDSSTYTKTEISQRYISGSEVYIEYTFTVKNEGDVEGYASQIVDYLPDGMNFNSSMNSDWYTGSDGNLYTTALANTVISPGETKTFTLVLSKTMTNENTGTVSNTAEIASDYNIYGISDKDSTPGNNNQSEDDFARADAIISVGTGGTYIYISVIITTVLLIGIAITIIRIRKKKNENTVTVDLEGGV